MHAFYAETEVILELRETPVRGVAIAQRSDAVRPGRARRSDVKHILQVAAVHFDELVRLWEQAHA